MISEVKLGQVLEFKGRIVKVTSNGILENVQLPLVVQQPPLVVQTGDTLKLGSGTFIVGTTNALIPKGLTTPIPMNDLKLDDHGVPMVSKEDIARGFSLVISHEDEANLCNDQVGFVCKDNKLELECYLTEFDNVIYHTLELNKKELMQLKTMLNSMELDNE